MNIQTSALEGVSIVTSTRFNDNRGSFGRLFCDQDLANILEGRKIVQCNHSVTITTGTIRGMHIQKPPAAEMKMVRCIKGRVLDVAVDLRQGSPTFLAWHAEELSAANNKMLIIPEGCAHGFQVLEAHSELIYFHTAYYDPDCEEGVLFNDPLIDIDWPLPANGVSKKDLSCPQLHKGFTGIKL